MTPQHIGKTSEREMNEMAEESYRQITGQNPMTPPQQRILDISRCYDCPHLRDSIRCRLTEQFIVDATKIPASCTLPTSRPAPTSSELAATAYQAGIECGREEGAAQAREESTQGRKVITLCGSVKFWDEYREWNARLTLEGNIVFSCGLSLKEGYEDVLIDLPIEDVKKDLDFIHLRKIDLSDEIFVLNVGGYIGESTKREIAYAESKGKMVKFLESLRSREGGERR